MLDLYLKYVQWKQLVKIYLLGKINKPKSVTRQIIEDVNMAFLSGNEVFKLYLFESEDGSHTLSDYAENVNSEYLAYFVDLHTLYYMVVEGVTVHYSWFNDIYVVSNGKGNNKYLEIYRKNYKQVIDN